MGNALKASSSPFSLNSTSSTGQQSVSASSGDQSQQAKPPAQASTNNPFASLFPAGSSQPQTGSGGGSTEKGWVQSLKDNPVFAGGAGIALLGVGATVARRGVMSGILTAQKHLTVSLEIPSKDRAYQWVLQWISANARKTQHLGVETSWTKDVAGNVHTNFDFVPSPGRHWLRYGRHVIQVSREREKSMIDLNTGQPWETVTLTTLGRSRKVFQELLHEAKQQALKREEGKTLIYHALGIEWRQFGQPRRRRPMHSVILAPGLAERITGDVKEFGANQQWYADRGIPYRRGYLLHGPPGCGKSSFIQALAGQLGYNICILNLNERGLTDDKLMMLLSTPPPRSIILLEDVDAALSPTRDAEAKQTHYGVTFSGLLNALDGVASAEERIVFMTTNYLERLDPALIRPGRVDVKEHIGLATPEQIKLMFLRFYPDQAELASKFVDQLGDASLSVADLQGFLMLYKGKPQEALSSMSDFLSKKQAARK